ncbi:transmembrane protein, putative (macronuclear) [Tetrahymena thermophila SB210]|uniref:Transmembrane protein, putative n=1 Tax=Tetrahymena thermophila (strain SB210) TaxID=312017 RepID=W7XB38_TETTS|nr:transmembrane protein, putative [Tetrahymena thermophila SB210]EWS74557.1 transmembrane protein, putative [Tetrahymena thermophila SB210]|eukprot:XP_012652931.1 transmembrane protein, putative [Tetrahymena thermophila SB210]
MLLNTCVCFAKTFLTCDKKNVRIKFKHRIIQNLTLKVVRQIKLDIKQKEFHRNQTNSIFESPLRQQKQSFGFMENFNQNWDGVGIQIILIFLFNFRITHFYLLLYLALNHQIDLYLKASCFNLCFGNKKKLFIS